jgi:fatty acid desaturase
VDKLAELAGFGLVLAFLWFVWPPLVLLGAGILLVAYANTRSRSGRLGIAAGAAWAAARRAYLASRDVEGDNVRRIA